MNKFGTIKSKMLTKITESYSKQNKKEVKDILGTIKENNPTKITFKEKLMIKTKII